MRKSINTKILAVVLAVVCVLAFGISAVIVNTISAKGDSNAVVQDGDANGLRGGEKSAPIGTAIATADQLRTWLRGSATHGYLTQWIDDWRKDYSGTELNLGAGRVLDGDGHGIVAHTNNGVRVPNGDTVFGYIVDRNFGTIKNLKVWTGNHVGKVAFNNPSNVEFGTTGFCKEGWGTMTMGVVAGINQGIIDNCVIDVDHAIQNTWDDNTEMHWTYAALGGVAGANFTTSTSKGIISNTTVNMNEYGGLVVGVFAKRAGASRTTGRSRVAAIAGMGNTTNASIVSFKNNTVNYNGGVIGVVANNADGDKNLFAAGVTITVDVSDPQNEGSNSQTPRVEGLIFNGKPNFRALWEPHGNRRAAFTVLQSDGSRESNVYIADGYSYPSNFINSSNGGPAHNAKWYTLPSNSSSKFEGNKVKFTRTNLNLNQIIYSIHGQQLMEQQISQIGTTEKTVTFTPKTANGQRIALDIEMGKTENVTRLSYDAETRAFDNQRHDAKFRNSQGIAITVLAGGPTIEYTGGNMLVGTHRATYTPGGNNVVGIDASSKTVYICSQSLQAEMTITPRVLTMDYNFNDVYDSYLHISGLLGEATVWVNSNEFKNSKLNFVQWGYYTIRVGNDNYVMPEGFPTDDVEIGARIFRADSRILIAEDLPTTTVEIGYGGVCVKKRLDSIKLSALSNKYGSKITEITGAVNSNAEITNSSYTATIALHKDIVRLGLKEENVTVTAIAESNNAEYGTATVNKANPTIGETLTYTATALQGYTFLGWTDDGKYVSFDATYTTIAGMQGKELIAVFADSCNVIILNGDREVGKLNLTADQIASLPNVGGTITAEEANLGNAATLAVDRQAYNDFYGWYVISIKDGVYTLQAIYADAVTNVNVSIDGEVAEYAINSDITLDAGSYVVNGVAITVNRFTTLKALAGLTIVSGNTGTAEASATGVYDADNEVLQVNAVMADNAKLTIKLVNTKTNDSVTTNAIKGRLVANISGGKDIIQAIVKIDQGFLTFAQGKIEARVYANDVLVGTIVVREA